MIAIVMAALGASAPSWAAFHFVEPSWDSMTQLLALARAELGRERVLLRSHLDWSELTSADGLLVIHPTSQLSFRNASTFLSKGGRVAVVDDFGKGDELLRRFHIRRVNAPADPLNRFNDNPKLPIATPSLTTGSQGPRKHPLVNAVDGIHTNHPSALKPETGIRLTPVLEIESRTADSSLLAVIGVIGNAKECGLGTVAGTEPKQRCGRLFAMADGSAFINLMMTFRANRTLATALLHYLLEDDAWGPRGGRLYVLSNRFSQEGNYASEQKLQARLEAFAEQSEEWLSGIAQKGLPKHVALALAVAAGLLTSLWVWSTSAKPYEKPNPHHTRPVSPLAQGGVAGRAAVLSAPTTPPALVLAEMKSAYLGVLQERLRMPHHSSIPQVIGAIRAKSLLSPGAATQLEEELNRLAAAEATLSGATSGHHNAKSVGKAHERLEELLAQVLRKRGS